MVLGCSVGRSWRMWPALLGPGKTNPSYTYSASLQEARVDGQDLLLVKLWKSTDLTRYPDAWNLQVVESMVPVRTLGKEGRRVDAVHVRLLPVQRWSGHENKARKRLGSAASVNLSVLGRARA